MGGHNTTNQDSIGNIFHIGDNIQHGVDAITEIHVDDSAFVVHHLVAACAPPAVGVGGLVGNALIGFHFHDDAAGQLTLLEGKDMFAQKVAGNG